MEIKSVEKNTHGHCVYLSGDFDAQGCKDIRSELEEMVENYPETILSIDLEDVQFIDSSGIGAIVFMFKRLTAVGSELKLCNVKGQPKELISLLRVHEVISVSWLEETAA